MANSSDYDALLRLLYGAKPSANLKPVLSPLPPIKFPIKIAPLSKLQQAFIKLKTNLELTDTFDEIIQTRHNAVRSVIENLGTSIKDSKLIGSLQRKTRIHPKPDEKFDIDILINLGEFYGWVYSGGISPADAMMSIKGILEDSERYSQMDPQSDQPTVTFDYKDNVKVELVPAYLDMIGYSPDGRVHSPIGRGYWVPKDGKWILADYDYDAEYVSKQNESTGGLLIPIIKMLKAIKRTQFPMMESYHLEIMASHIIPVSISVRRQHGLSTSYHALISDFFEHAVNLLVSPIKFPGSNSLYVQLDPGYSASITDKLGKIKAHIHKVNTFTNEGDKIEGWKKLFGDEFPSSI